MAIGPEYCKPVAVLATDGDNGGYVVVAGAAHGGDGYDVYYGVKAIADIDRAIDGSYVGIPHGAKMLMRLKDMTLIAPFLDDMEEL